MAGRTQNRFAARHRRRRLAVAIHLAAGLMSAGPLVAQDVDLAELGTTHPGFRIDGIDELDTSGLPVSGAGDVNGDGLDDVIIGAQLADPGGRTNAGECYVVFGKSDPTPVDLAGLGSGGFRIDGKADGDETCVVAGAGDVNGDGLDDVVIGARRADVGAKNSAGQVHVIFGKTDGNAVDLASPGSAGFRIDGAALGDFAGWSTAGAGDVNGDGMNDVALGAPSADANGKLDAGRVYVIFGKSDVLSVDLSNLGAAGFRIDGAALNDQAGFRVGGGGDVNGDGLDDVIVGNRYSSTAHVVFGKSDTAAVDLANLGAGGFRISGSPGDHFGPILTKTSAVISDDVSGDGLADIIIGADLADPAGRTDAGEIYLVFGKADSSTVALGSLGTETGFRILGAAPGDQSGFSVSGAGDLNGDGLADMIIGSPFTAFGGNNGAGRSYVVFGKRDATTVDLAALGSAGFVIGGVDANDSSGASVAGAGDVNGDGVMDLVIGATGVVQNGAMNAGATYVVFGNQDAADTQVAPPPMGLAAGDRLGGAVAVDGNLMVVGRPNADATGTDSGQVVVYRVEGTRLIEDRIIDVPATHFATNFGASLALEGDRLVVGAPGTDGTQPKGPLQALQAAIFERLSDGSWDMKGTLPPMNGNSGDDFGAAVALDGQTVVVGAPGDNANGIGSGATYVYEVDDGDNLVESRKLKPPDESPGGKFGAAVAAENGQIAVGSPAGQMGGAASGLVRLYQQVSDNLMDLNDQGAMTGSRSGDGDAFGTAVALQGSTLAVGAPGEDGGGVDRGAAYVFDPQSMVEMGRVEPDQPQDNAGFGTAVGTNGTELAAGAPGLNGNSGGAYRFSANALVQLRLTRALAGQQGFGAAVTLTGDALAIGAPASAGDAGAAVLQRNASRVFRSGFEN